MSIFSTTKFSNFDDLLTDQLRDLYDAEQRLTDALPKMLDAASSPALKQAISTHLAETENQVHRLERVFALLGQKPKTKACKAMKGLIAEGEEVLDAEAHPDLKDAAIIAAAQRVEHYEIAAYGTARTFALRVGQAEAARLLQETLDEEKAADEKLSEIAEESVNLEAALV